MAAVHYKLHLEKRDMERLSWTPVSSTIHGLRYTVTNLRENTRYGFRVRAENQYGESTPIEMVEPVVVKSPFSVPDAPSSPEVLE
ncbi:putative titin-like [Apostichopus japonicus]|uniref:Putative titin-like n=1 Tax=Stichopus japonicus TaxID=307972 RepID=A0A2G8LL28_STIJA|nr:putative titin-like [Apostichopus japonicus]